MANLQLAPDAKQWHRKWSTWLALASAASTAALGAFAVLPDRVQALMPDWALGTLGAVAIGSALLVPIATSLSQPKLQKPQS